MNKAPKTIEHELVFFDLGEVVVDVDIMPARKCWEVVAKRDESEFTQVFFDSGIKYQMDVGILSADEGLTAVSKLTDNTVSTDIARLCWNAIITVRPHVVEVIKELSTKVRVAVISNTDPIHAAYIEEQTGLALEIERWIYSFDAQSMKPSARIFDYALDAVSLTAEKCLIIDDRLDNLETARAVGMDTIHFDKFQSVLRGLADRNLVSAR